MNETYKKLLNEVEKDHQQLGKEKVLIVDGLNTFIRSWTVNPTMDDNGDHIGGIVGFLKGIGFAIREQNATRCIIVFDGKGDSKSRKDLYSGYKENRASAVKNYLVENGIEADRLTSAGYGKSRPIDKTKAGKANNRRVEVKLAN